MFQVEIHFTNWKVTKHVKQCVHTYCNCGLSGTIPAPPSEAGVAGVMGPPGVIGGPPGVTGTPGVMGANGVCGGYKLALDGGITGFGVAPKEKLLRAAGDIMGL